MRNVLDMHEPELRNEVARLRFVVERNRVSFEKLKDQATRWRARALKAEAALAEARRSTEAGAGPLGDLFGEETRRTLRQRLFKKGK